MHNFLFTQYTFCLFDILEYMCYIFPISSPQDKIQNTEAVSGHLDCDSTTMENFVGKWKFESGQGFDEFLKDRGIGKLSQYL